MPFIPHGPANILSCSFSPCGMKLVTSEDDFVKVWDVRKKDLLVKVAVQFDHVYDCVFSSCDIYIIGRVRFLSGILEHWKSKIMAIFLLTLA